MSKTAIILFSGFNMRALLAFIRTLEKNALPYYIIASAKDDPIFNTLYEKKVIVTREKQALHLQDITHAIEVLQITVKADNYLIAPSTEALNRFVLKHRNLFTQLKCLIPLVEEDLYIQISDKYSFSMLCSEYNITVPKEYTNPTSSHLPLVAKPKAYVSKEGEIYAPQIIKTIKELEAFLTSHKQDDFYFQEYVNGRSIYLLYYFDENKNIFKFSQENLIQQENGKSMLLAKSANYHNNKISSKFEYLFTSINFRGLVMIELKLMNDKFYMIEANPRFWGPSQLFVDAKINLFDNFLVDFNLIKSVILEVQKQQSTYYYWDDGISENIDNRKNLAFYNYDKEHFNQNKKLLTQIEIYNRSDIKPEKKGKNESKNRKA